MAAWERCGAAVAAGAVTALALAACGSSSGAPATGTATGAGGSGAHAAPTDGRFPVAVSAAGFPRRQHIAGGVALTLAVRNTGSRPLPDVAVTICARSCAPGDRSGEGTAAQAFGTDIRSAPDTASPSRPLWIVDRGPGGCRLNCNASGGDAGGGVTASSNTWALGRLAPGATARFTWALIPVVAGSHTVAWEVAGDLTGRARAVLAGGGVPRGTLRASVDSAPPRVRVTPSGRVVTTAAG